MNLPQQRSHLTFLAQQQKEEKPSSPSPQVYFGLGVFRFISTFIFCSLDLPLPHESTNKTLSNLAPPSRPRTFPTLRSFLLPPFLPISFFLPFLNSPPFFFMASFLKVVTFFFKGSWVLLLAVFSQRSSDPSPGCFCFFFVASPKLFSILPHWSPVIPLFYRSPLSLFPRGDRKLSRARVPFLGVLGFPSPRPLRWAKLTVGFFCLIWCSFCLIWCPSCLIWCPSCLIWCPSCLIWCPFCLIWCP